MFSGSFSMDLPDFYPTHLKPSPSCHLCTRAWSHTNLDLKPPFKSSMSGLLIQRTKIRRQAEPGGLPQGGPEDIPMAHGNRCLMGFPDFSLVLNAVLPSNQEDSARLAWAMLQTLPGSPAHAEQTSDFPTLSSADPSIPQPQTPVC